MTSNDASTDVAIIGMSGLFPGAKDIHAYWQNIVNKVDSIHEAPDEWAAPYFDPELSQTRIDSARIYTRKVGLLGELAEFNPLEFGIPPKAVEGDPSHFLALKLARNALRDADYEERSFNRERAGIIVGRGSNPNRGDATGFQYGLVIDQTLDLLKQLLPQLDQSTLKEIDASLRSSLPPMEIEQAPGLVSNVLTGRIANRLDLMGPNYLVDAACSSALIAVELAIRELLSDRSDMMLVGGIQGSMPPQIYMLFCQLNALSRGDIRPFDQAAGGTLLSEGAGFLVLKRLADAQRDGDRIYAVIKGVGTSSDGKAQGLLAPRLDGEILALQRAYQQTGIDPSTITLIEAHGTGIPLGDRTEIKALSHLFGPRQGVMPKCALGSVKSMIGHCIPAAGIASLVKTALSLYYKTLPPTLCDRVNPDLAIETTPFYINTETRPWIHNSELPRRAGVNAFGFGGINAHAILEEYWEPPNPQAPVWQPALQQQESWSQWPTELVLFAGESRQALITLLHLVEQALEANPNIPLADLAYTLSQQSSGSKRLALLAKTVPDLQRKLDLALEKLQTSDQTAWVLRGGMYYAEDKVYTGQTAFLFSTEGSQYPNMLAELCLYFPQVRAWFDFLDETFTRDYAPSQVIFPAPTALTEDDSQWATTQLFAADLATETVSTASLAIYELLQAFGIPCEAMVGHSAGEHVALRAAGMAYFASRSHLKEQLRRLNQVYSELDAAEAIPTGHLLSIGAVDYEAIEQLLRTFADDLHLVADNCPSQVLMFATERVVDAVSDRVKALGGICMPVPFDRAYHTPLFHQGVQALRTYYEGIELGSCDICVYSCATAELYPSTPAAIRDLLAEQWEKPVRFRETIERLYQDGVRTFIEVGAGNTLTAFVESILKGKDCTALPTNTQHRGELAQLQTVLGRLFVQGLTLDWTPLYCHRNVKQIDFKTPQFPEQKGTLHLKFLLPRMSLSADLVQTVQAKLAPPSPNEVAIPPVLDQHQEDEITPTLHPAPQAKSVSLDIAIATEPLPTPVPSSQRSASPTSPIQPSTATASFPAPVPPISEPSRSLSVLMSHFELMQEFLESQDRIASRIFCSPETASAASPTDQPNGQSIEHH